MRRSSPNPSPCRLWVIGAQVGIHPASQWSNPEPEVVLVVDARGRLVGATLGNDVNLRDFEGRSALLLGRGKDNNGSCSIGPFIRLIDGQLRAGGYPQGRSRLGDRRRRRLPAGGRQLDVAHLPRSARPHRPDHGEYPSISRWNGALHRDHVCADQGPRPARRGLHPQARRPRRHFQRQARHAGQYRPPRRPHSDPGTSASSP